MHTRVRTVTWLIFTEYNDYTNVCIHTYIIHTSIFNRNRSLLISTLIGTRTAVIVKTTVFYFGPFVITQVCMYTYTHIAERRVSFVKSFENIPITADNFWVIHTYREKYLLDPWTIARYVHLHTHTHTHGHIVNNITENWK